MSRLMIWCNIEIFASPIYSFCQLLARRYFGFHCAEEGVERVRDFALTELLPDDDPRSATRGHSVLLRSKQHAFLHDYFFTNYHHRILRLSPLVWSNNPRSERMRPVPISLPVAILVLVGLLALVFWLVVLFVIGGPFGVSKFAFHTVASLLLALFMFFAVKSAMSNCQCTGVKYGQLFRIILELVLVFLFTSLPGRGTSSS